MATGLPGARGTVTPHAGRLYRGRVFPGQPEEITLPARLAVLVSGGGTNLQALLDACADPAYGAQVVAVGADRDGIDALARAERAGVPSFVLRVGDFPDRDAWDRAMVDEVAKHEPDIIV